MRKRRLRRLAAGVTLAGAGLATWPALRAASGPARVVELADLPGLDAGTPDLSYQALVVEGYTGPITASGRAALEPPRGLFAWGASSWLTREAQAAEAVRHDAVGCVVAEQHPQLAACFPGTDVARAQVRFRTAAGPWYAVDMAPEGACFTSVLPKPKPTLKEFEYYVSAIDTAFDEVAHPEAAPVASHRVRVVAKEGDCAPELRVALRLASALGPILLRAPAGAAATPEGFDPAGIVSPREPLRNVAASLVATGAASGGVIQLQVANGSGSAWTLLSPDAIVLLPAKGGGKPVAAGKAAVQTHTLNGYCLDFAKPPPPPGTTYRLATAGPDLARADAIRSVVRAGRRLAKEGRLHPDSDPAAYADSIKQWAVWSRQAGWNEEQFGKAFLERTRKTVLELKRPFTPEMESGLRAVVPGRWRDIEQVLGEAKP